MNILFLSNWVPYPADNGSRLRIYNLLKGLAPYHQLHLLAFSDGQREAVASEHLTNFCASVAFVPKPVFDHNRKARVQEFISLKPRSLSYLYSPGTAEKIKQAIQAHKIDLVIASQFKTALYHEAFAGVPAIFEEVENASFAKQSTLNLSNLTKLRRRLMWVKQQLWMRQLFPHFQAVTVASQPEHDLIRRSISRKTPMAVLPNGVDLSQYRKVQPDPKPCSLIFTGAFSFHVNYYGMYWFMDEVYPRIKAQVPQAQLIITGDHGDRHLPDLPDVTLTGYVEDVKPLIAGATISIVPLLEGGGTRLKILEAMALSTPVVATTKGAEGLNGRDGEHLLLADTPENFADAVVALLQTEQTRQRLAEAGQALVSAEYSWSTIVPKLLTLIDQTANGTVAMQPSF